MVGLNPPKGKVRVIGRQGVEKLGPNGGPLGGPQQENPLGGIMQSRAFQ